MKNFIKKIPILLIVILFTLIGTATITYACTYATCGCADGTGDENTADDAQTCVGTVCWYSSDLRRACPGHDWDLNDIEEVGGETVTTDTSTCTKNGSRTTTYVYSYTTVTCGICQRNMTGVGGSREISSETINAPGCNWSTWAERSGDDDYHYSTCQNSCHNTSYDGPKTKSEAHNKVGEENWHELTSAAQVVKSPTCTEWGQTKRKYEKGKECTICTWTSIDIKFETHTDISPLHHNMSSWTKIDNDTHKVSCSRSGCGHSHTESHYISDWMNSGRGYRYKDCIGSSTGFNCGSCFSSSCSATGCSSHSHCSSNFCVVNDSNGCGAREIRTQWYVLSLTLDGNGGTVHGSTRYNTNVTYGNTIKLPDETQTIKPGYKFIGWDYNNDTRFTSFAPGEVVTAQRINPALKDDDEESILFAKWRKTITYNFNYYDYSTNKETQKTLTINYYNSDESVVIKSFIDGKEYHTIGDHSTRTIDDGTITISGITSATAIKYGNGVGVYTWNFNGLAKNNSSSIAPRYNGTKEGTTSITVNANDAPKPSDNLPINFFASYYRQPEIKFVDYSDNAKVERYINASSNTAETKYIDNGLTAGINNNQTVQNITTVYANYNGDVEYPVKILTYDLNSMKLEETTGKNKLQNEPWTSVGWTTGSPTEFGKSVQTLGTKKINRQTVYNRTGTAGTFDDIKAGSTFDTYQDMTYYGMYYKDITLTVKSNGGKLTNPYNGKQVDSFDVPVRRYVNIAEVYASTKEIVTLNNPIYANETGCIYSFKTWTYDALEVNDSNIEEHSLKNTFYCTDDKTRWHYDTANDCICSTCAQITHILRNNTFGIFQYTPLVTETIYAAWTNETIPDPEYEPEVSISKAAEWYNASNSDTGTYDFDALGNINLDGIVKVTITVDIKNLSGVNTKDMYVTDYFNSNIWTYYQGITPVTNKGTLSRSGNKLTWNIPNNSSGKLTCTYYLQLKEAYWTKDASGDGKYINNELGTMASDSNGSAYSNMVNGKLYYNYYTNRIPDINKYLKSLNNGQAIPTDGYYHENTDARNAYVWIAYTINGGHYHNIKRELHNSTPYVKMRQVNFIPTVSNGVNIETDENNTKDYLNGMHTNIYHDYSSTYNNTYFVKYNTKGDYDSTFKISMASQLTKSYSYYQITDNLFDIKADTTKKEQVIDNRIDVSATKNNKSVLFTENIAGNADGSNKVNTDTLNKKHLRTGFSSGLLLRVNASITLHSSVNTGNSQKGYVQYENAAASTKNTVYATNQNDLHISIYPFVKTTNTKTGISYSTSDRIDSNKRLDLIIDATDPVITADGNLISADGSDKTTWNKYNQYCKDNNIKSDGYIDINLINKSTNNTSSIEEYDYVPGTENPYSYEFKFYDEVSGISDPTRATDDWIKTKHDNVIVTLTRVDDGKVLFNSATNKNYANNKYVSLSYNTSAYNVTNKNASLKVQFYANDPDNLGHIQLKIRVYDNVYNYTDKVYDFYVFALTADISVVETLLNLDPTRYNDPSLFYNGEQGRINISANGYVDRVIVNFDADMNQAYLKDYNKFYGKFAEDVPETINGDYPNTDYNSKQYVAANDPFKASKLYAMADNKLILPVNCQQPYWSYLEGKYGGLILSTVDTNANKGFTINTKNIALKKMLPEIITKYMMMSNFGETSELIMDEYNGVKYIIANNAAYINPVYNPDGTVQTAEYIIKVMSDGTLYGIDNVPTALTIDGAVTVPITYTVNIGAGLTPEQIITALANGASIPDTVFYPYISSNWQATSGGYRRPLSHYFYTPLQAKPGIHNVTLTAYQDSETGWVHKVSVTVKFNNVEPPTLKDLNTIIQDN